MKPTSRLTFKPRVSPRNGNDWTLSLLASPLIVALVALLFLVPVVSLTGLVYLVTSDSFPACIVYLLTSLAWTAWATLLPVQRLEFSEAGLHIVRPLRAQIVSWDDIERVEQLSPAEFLRAMSNPRFYTGKIASPASFSYADYVLIHHKGGSILFPPQDKKVFLDALRKRWERKETELTQETEQTAPWYSTAQALREENRQTLRSRREG